MARRFVVSSPGTVNIRGVANPNGPFLCIESGPTDATLDMGGGPSAATAGAWWEDQRGYTVVTAGGSINAGTPLIFWVGVDKKELGPGTVVATVPGPVVVTQGTTPWVVGDGGGSLTVDGTVAISNDPIGVKGKNGSTIAAVANPFPVELENSIVGVKGKDGTNIATGPNPFPVEIENTTITVNATNANPIPVKGKDGATIASTGNPVPVEVENLVGVKGKDGATIAAVANPVPIEVENTVTVTGVPNPIGVKGKDGATIASTSNPVPTELQGTSLVGVKGKDGSTLASTTNPVPVEVEGTATITGSVSLNGGTLQNIGTINPSETTINPGAVGTAGEVAVDRVGRLIMKRTAAAADILTGSRTSNGVIITVPANKTWRGSVLASVAHAIAPGGAGALVETRIVWAPGTGGTPAYDIARAQVDLSGVLLASLIGSNGASTSPVSDVILYAGTTAGAINLVLTASPNQAFGSVSGSVEDAT